MKTCTQCGAEKQLEDFHRDKNRKDGRNARCKECAKANTRQWYYDNHERALQYRKDNADRINEYSREYHQRRLAEDPEYYSEKARKWQQENPESFRTAQVAQRIKSYGLAPQLTEEEREITVEYRKAIANDPCWYCGNPEPEWTEDHKIPLSRGGTDHWWNLVRACAADNMSKHAKTPEEYFEYLNQKEAA